MKETLSLTSCPLQTSQVNWQYREMNGDGTFTSWTNFQGTPEGPEFNYTTTISGIFQVQAIITVNGASETWQYNRQQDDPYGADSDGNFNPIYAKGQPDYFGVVDSQWQIDVRNQARALLGSTAYSEAGSLPPIYSGGPTFAGHDKCNIFVYMMCNAAGSGPRWDFETSFTVPIKGSGSAQVSTQGPQNKVQTPAPWELNENNFLPVVQNVLIDGGSMLIGGAGVLRGGAELSISQWGKPIGKWLSQGRYWRLGASGTMGPTLRIGSAHFSLNFFGF